MQFSVDQIQDLMFCYITLDLGVHLNRYQWAKYGSKVSLRKSVDKTSFFKSVESGLNLLHCLWGIGKHLI